MKTKFLYSKKPARIILLFLLLSAVGMTKGYAYDFLVNGIYYNITSSTEPRTVEVTYKTTSYNSYSGDITIPSSVTYDGVVYSVTSIGISAFYRSLGLTSVVIPNSIISINNGAFRACSGLTSITIPESVTEIKRMAFDYCTGLTTVTIPSSVTTIEGWAFENCTGLTAVYYTGDIGQWCNISFGLSYSNPLQYAHNLYINNTLVSEFVLPETVTEIKDNVFQGCTTFTGELIIPGFVTSIGYGSFSGCTGLNSLSIPNSVTSIGANAFSGCTGLTSVSIPNGITQISGYIFQNCTGLTSILIPNSVTSIETGAFSGCTGLTSVTLPDSVISIGGNAFDGCTGLTSISIPNSVISIGVGAFGNCTGLTSVLIPNSVISIAGRAFSGCTGLVSISIPESVVQMGYNPFYGTGWYNNQPDGVLYLDGCCLGFKGSSPTGELILEEGTRLIASSAFSNCSGLSGSLTIPNSVSYIGGYAFYQCSGLDGNLVLGNSVTFIGSRAFFGCNFQGELVLSDAMTSIEDHAFYYCTGFTGSLTIPNSVVTIGNSAFMGCSGFDGTLTLGNAVTFIGDNAFMNCSGLNGDLTIPESVMYIGMESFYNTGWYNSQPDGIIYQNHCCIGVKGAKPTGDLVIADSTRVIAGEAFYTCSGLTSVSIPNTVKSIALFAFGHCSSLTSVTIPSSVEIMGGAFIYCTNLSEVYYNATNCAYFEDEYEAWKWFDEDYALSSVYIGSNVEVIPDKAFDVNQTYNGYTYDGLNTIVSMAANPPSIGVRTFDDTDKGVPVYIPCGTLSDYQTAEYWEEFTNFIEMDSMCAMQVTVSINPSDAGTVTGAGYYFEADTCILVATANPGYAFINWVKDDEVVSTEATYSFIVSEDASFVANFEDQRVTQTTDFLQGYNWWSTYIEQSGIDGLQMLQDSLGDNGIVIRSQASGYNNYYPSYGWYGSLSSINNESSYRIATNSPFSISMKGVVADPSQHPITLSHGWTWIGYVPSTTMDVNAAMAGVNAVQGDKLKSQQGYADYYLGYGWFGSLNTIEPGMGLMYYSTNGETVTFTYPDSNKSGELKKNLTAEDNHWVPNVYAYPDNMTVMAVVELDDQELSRDNYELAAFANGECRGSVKLTYAEPLHRYVAFLTISGKDAAELSFRLYDTETNAEYYDAEESLGFVANAMVGAADDLYTIHFRGTTGMDELASKVQVYPNPVNAGERFSIGMADSEMKPVHVEIVNALGVETLRATSVQTPVSIVAPATAGVYTLRITLEGKGTVVRKLVVK